MQELFMNQADFNSSLDQLLKDTSIKKSTVATEALPRTALTLITLMAPCCIHVDIYSLLCKVKTNEFTISSSAHPNIEINCLAFSYLQTASRPSVTRLPLKMKIPLISFFTVVLIGLQSAIAIPYDVIYDWKQMDYAFNTAEDRENWLHSGKFIPANNVITGIKVSRNRIFLTVPRWRNGVPSTLNYVPYNSSAMESISDAKLIPYPSWELNEVGNCSALQYVQSMEIDPYGRIWIADVGRVNIFGVAPDNKCPPKLVLVDLKSDEVILTHVFPQEVVSRNSSFLNDLVVGCDSETDCWAYISDARDAKIIVYNLDSDKSWYARHESMHVQMNSTIISIEGKNYTFQTAVDGIALSPKQSSFDTLYYCPLSSYHLYSIDTSTLKTQLSGEVFGVDLRNVDNLGRRPSQSDGMIVDANGRLYYGLLGRNAIATWDTKEGKLSENNQAEIIQDDVEMQWVDTFAIDERADAFATTNRLHRFGTDTYNFNEVNFRVVRFHIGHLSYQYFPKM